VFSCSRHQVASAALIRVLASSSHGCPVGPNAVNSGFFTYPSRCGEAAPMMAISAVEKRFQVVVEDNIPLYELRWPIQFESKGTAQTNDVIVLVDHWSLWERV
jgi:hypothetical protein